MGNVTLINGNKCPLCGKEHIGIETNDDMMYAFECPNCNTYFAGIEFAYSEKYPAEYRQYDLEKVRHYLFYHKSKSVRDPRPVFCSQETFVKFIEGKYQRVYNVSPQDVENWYPKTFAEKIDKILLKLADMAVYEGAYIKVDKENRYLLYFTTNKHCEGVIPGQDENLQRTYIDNFLTNQNYVEIISDRIQLTPKAWERIYELQSRQPGNKKVFIAMKFDKETVALREAIKNGVTEAGYEAVIMDEVEHNNQIVPEMLYQIKNCRFTIAELTHSNNGAYYEAGYALGSGKQVIHICEENKFTSGAHFDVKQVNTITYKNINEIPEKLKRRIEATII